MQLAGIVNQLTTLGDPEPDGKVVLKYLQIARPRYKQLGVSRRSSMASLAVVRSSCIWLSRRCVLLSMRRATKILDGGC
jgi:hypothetical protein